MKEPEVLRAAIQEIASTSGPPLGSMRSIQRPTATRLEKRIRGLDNFGKVFAISKGEKVLLLVDPLLDSAVVDAIHALARARGATFNAIFESSTRIEAVPSKWRDAISEANLVVSTWFNSVLDPFFVSLRKSGQRWVKITYFRDIDLLESEQACFPLDVLGEILKATARKYPTDDKFELRFFDDYGSDFKIHFTGRMREMLLRQNRWRGDVTASEPGSYAQYVPMHGPNLWDRTSVGMDPDAHVHMEGTVFFQGAVGFPRPFVERIGLKFESDKVVEVIGGSPEATVLRSDLVNGRLIELGCGFNPAAPRFDIYPAGSNAPGAIHFGIDLPLPSTYMRRALPEWEEPAIHHDLCVFDLSATAGNNLIIDRGFLTALREPEVVAAAQFYGDPLTLLEGTVGEPN